MELNCILAFFALLASGSLLALLDNKKMFVIKNGKYDLSQSQSPKKIIALICATVASFFVGICCCFANISAGFEEEISPFTLLAEVILLIMCIFGLVIAGYAIIKPSHAFDFKIFGLGWNKKVNRGTNIVLFVLWLFITISLSACFQTFNCIVLGSAGILAIGLTTVIILIIGIGIIFSLCMNTIRKAIRKLLTNR